MKYIIVVLLLVLTLQAIGLPMLAHIVAVSAAGLFIAVLVLAALVVLSVARNI